MAKRRPLKDYQIEDGRHIAKRKSALIAHQMRVGKSNIAIYAADILQAKLVVVICPPNAKAGWREAIEEFRTGRWHAIICGDNYAGDLLKKLKAAGVRIGVLVIDESHREKNRDAARTQAVYGPECIGFGGLVELAERVYCLTGTPLPNNPMELWPMLRSIAPELIRNGKGRPMSYSAFMNKYCATVRTPFGYKIAGGKNYKQLKALLMGTGFCLRRLRKDVFGRDLQPPQTIYISPAKEYGAELAALEASPEGRAIREAIERGGLTALAKMEQQSSRLRRLFGLAKVPELSSLLADELESEPDKKIVIGFWHTDVGLAYAQALRRFQPLVFDGKTGSQARKDRIAKQFQNEKKYRVICAQIVAANMAVDFSAARDIVLAEWSFVGTENEQFASRIFNMNVSEPGFIRFAAMPGSTDSAIAAAASSKLAVAAKIFG